MRSMDQSVASSRSRALRSTAFVVLVAGGVGVAIPTLLLYLADGRLALGLGKARLLGLIPILAGAAVYLACVVQLTVRGIGIPAPMEPTRVLVVSGPYALVRNPMYVAASLFFAGIAVLADSAILLFYGLIVISIYYPWLVCLEERALAQRFGAAYTDYCGRVPRWLPTLPQRDKPGAAGP